MDIGTTIKNLRKKRGFNQNRLAEKADIKQSYLSLIENGNREPTIHVLNRISNALSVSIPFMVFYSIEVKDVPDNKRAMFDILHPHMKRMVDELIN